MTLSTHIIIASVIVKSLGANPLLAFFASLFSHYLSDAIPHWDYTLRSIDTKRPADERRFGGRKDFFIDLAKMGLDFFLGAGTAWWIFLPSLPEEWLLWALVSTGAVLPDFLQGVYYTRRAEFLLPLQRFHDLMHSKILLGPYPKLGVPFQTVIFCAMLWIASF